MEGPRYGGRDKIGRSGNEGVRVEDGKATDHDTVRYSGCECAIGGVSGWGVSYQAGKQPGVCHLSEVRAGHQGTA